MGLTQLPSAIPAITIAGRVFTDLTNLIVLHASVASNVSFRYSALRKADGTAYTPSGSKKLRILAIAVNSAASGAGQYNMGSCDNDCGILSATAPINPVKPCGGTEINVVATTGRFEFQLPFFIPNGKYGYLDGAGTGGLNCGMEVFGYEE